MPSTSSSIKAYERNEGVDQRLKRVSSRPRLLLLHQQISRLKSDSTNKRFDYYFFIDKFIDPDLLGWILSSPRARVKVPKEKKNAKGKGQQIRWMESMDNALIDLLVEEAALIDLLVEEAAKGNKCDKTFTGPAFISIS
ncbi:hypothetical protein NE237_009386 [Protea cynaroides]|uniref:Uncharacterized protein n=1 Tax=Protea cynaroides TaxID=273540 RepID=A0A9Q0KYH7_9MAGN|nr:hypothetical protein NE237_009386 [Protea cynaroides]